MAAVGINSRGIELVNVEERSGVKTGGVSDVAALGVGDDRDVLGDRAQGLEHDLHAAHAERLEEGEVGLVGADEVAGGVDDFLEEGGDVGMGHELRVGVEADAEVAVVALRRGLEFLKEHEGQPPGPPAPAAEDLARSGIRDFKQPPAPNNM